MHKTMLIFNPHSDKGRSGRKASDLRALVEEMGGADWQGSEYPTHATELAAEAGLHGYKTVVAVGGDGTVHEVVNGLMKIDALLRPRLGVVPIGSGNDFAEGVGVSIDSETAMRRVFQGEPHPIDMGLIQDNNERLEYFCNVAGIGFDAAINLQSRKLTSLQGFAMYLTATLQTIAKNFAAVPMRITYDGGVIEQPTMMFTVGNSPREGGGFVTTPDAKADDGIFDFACLKAVNQVRMMQLLLKVMNGTHVSDRAVIMGRTTHLVVEFERSVPIHLDGEMFVAHETNVRRIEITLVPGAIKLMM